MLVYQHYLLYTSSVVAQDWTVPAFYFHHVFDIFLSGSLQCTVFTKILYIRQ